MTSPNASNASRYDAKVQGILSEFLEEKQRETARNAPRKKASVRRPLLVTLALLCAAAWFAPVPASAGYAKPDPKLSRASIRAEVFLAARRIMQFRTERGRLPASTAEAGIVSNDITYLPGPDGAFALYNRSGPYTVTYDSSMPLQSFLGNSDVRAIEESGH